MRVEFVNTVKKVLARDEKSMFITGDLGFNAFEGIRNEFGKRFLNAGAAEQNMVGVAAGLAFEGYKPWIYSIAPFVTYRPLEQVRNDVCLHNLPVRIVGNGGGYTYGIMGSTHQTLEDLAVFKSLPNMTIYLPCTNNHVESAVEQISTLAGPSYLRLGYAGFQSNRAALSENPKTLTRRYSSGTKATVIGLGQAVQIALKAMDDKILDESSVSVFGIAKFPFDWNADRDVLNSCEQTQNVVVLDEHYLYGSLAESLCMDLPPVKKRNVMTPFYSTEHSYGTPNFHAKQAGFTPERIVEHLGI